MFQANFRYEKKCKDNLGTGQSLWPGGEGGRSNIGGFTAFWAPKRGGYSL